MRIGLFTDTYRPSVNGIVYVVESMKRQLEAEGHEVYIFCPARSIRPKQHAQLLDEDDKVIRFSSVNIKGAFYDDYDTTIFFPPRVLGRIRALELDVIHFFTPGQVGMMGVYAAHKTKTPLIAQHCTDLREYVEHYKDPLLLPGVLALVALVPLTMKVSGRDLKEIVKLYKPRRGAVQWNIEIVERMITLIYSKCQGVIALSRKSQHQLEDWQHLDEYLYPVTLLPNGVDPLPRPTKRQIAEFREEFGIDEQDEVFGFVGRLGSEKNLEILIKAAELIVAKRPRARLLFVGDFEYRPVLEQMAADSTCPDRVTFTGALPRETLGRVYQTMSVFTFPSLTDTQGWVVHEAALSGVPLVLIDKELSEVLKPGVNGEYAENTPESVAETVVGLLGDDDKRQRYSNESRLLAEKFTEREQVRKIIKMYEAAVKAHKPRRGRLGTFTRK